MSDPDGWLGDARDFTRVRAVLRNLAPSLRDESLTPVMRRYGRQMRPSETVLVGTSHILKVAWTPDEAESLARQRAVLTSLHSPRGPFATPSIIASGSAPVSYVYRRLAGHAHLTYESVSKLTPAATSALAGDWAALIADLQSDARRAVLQAADIPLPRPTDVEPYESPDAIREVLLPFRTETWLPGLIDEAAEVLAAPVDRAVLLHGDLGGHNVLATTADQPRVTAVIDFENASIGDPAFDLRHLLSQADSPDFCCEVVRRLETAGVPVDRPRMVAYNVLLDLGDIAHRLVDDRPVPGGIDARITALPSRLSRAGHILGIAPRFTVG